MKIDYTGKTLEVPMEEPLQEKYQTFMDDKAEPARPRQAATVMLVREVTDDTSGQPRREAFMMQRVKTMAFVPEAVVFPGGGVDVRDADEHLPWTGPSPADWASRMDVDEETARRVVVAAAREVFEECGVLLASTDDGDVSSLARDMWLAEREHLVKHEVSFAEVLMNHNLVLRTDLLGFRSHWLTPEYEPRRYNTFFFAARVPEGQMPDDLSTESNRAAWADARRLLKGREEGKVRLLHPTAYNLTQLVIAPSLDTFLAGRSHVPLTMFKPGTNEAGEMVMRCQLP